VSHEEDGVLNEQTAGAHVYTGVRQCGAAGTHVYTRGGAVSTATQFSPRLAS